MGLLLTAVAGLVVWIVLWSFAIKGLDAFLITIAMVLTAIVVRSIWPFLPGNRQE